MTVRTSLLFAAVLALTTAECHAQSIDAPPIANPLTIGQPYTASGTCGMDIYSCTLTWGFRDDERNLDDVMWTSSRFNPADMTWSQPFSPTRSKWDGINNGGAASYYLRVSYYKYMATTPSSSTVAQYKVVGN